MPRKFIFWVFTLTILFISNGCASKNHSPDIVPASPVAGEETASNAPIHESAISQSPGANLTNTEGQKLETIYFDFDSHALNAVARKVLQNNAMLLNQNPSMAIIVEGHCDERGSDEYNLALGDQRAYAIKDYLVALNISADRLTTVSYGEEKPAVHGHDETSWEKNRRAELK